MNTLIFLQNIMVNKINIYAFSCLTIFLSGDIIDLNVLREFDGI